VYQNVVETDVNNDMQNDGGGNVELGKG